MQEENLIHQFIERNEEAISESKQRYASYCLAIAQNILTNREDAEECLNDALLAAWNSIPPHHPENLKTYLGKLTREISIDRFRKKNAQKRIPSGFVIPFEELEEMIGRSEVAASVEEAELSRRISLFLRSLKEHERNVFIRRYWYCDSVESICARFGFGKSRVLMMLKRTRDRLAGYLKKEGF